MATARNRKRASQRSLKLSLADFRLIDFRIVSMKCERIIAPEDAPKGTYKTKVTAKLGFPVTTPEKNSSEFIVAVSLSMQGNKIIVEKDVRTVVGKSFNLELEAEGLCKVLEKNITEKNVTDEIVNGLVAQVYPLAITRARTYLVDMGYRGVRPELGYDYRNTVELDPEAEERTAA